MRLARGSPGAGHNGPVRSDRCKVAPEPGWASGHERRYRDEPDRRSARAVAPTPFAQYQEIGSELSATAKAQRSEPAEGP